MDGQFVFAMFLITLLVGPVLMILSIIYGRRNKVKWLWILNSIFLLFSLGVVVYYLLRLDEIDAMNAPGGTGVLVLLLMSSYISIPTAFSFFSFAGAVFMQQRKKAKEDELKR
ncbi:hypothetical protein E2R51_17220 [Jeotgalibacillus sp. S-D1]|uniref:hypothetical protein n=1 Tax=Jeotgalibacillus sp. S-D1 TaxID=2552189 RepID=UPI00105A9E3D|nr:hypothetical protein [Jeotgalibacillus sp. S-D1]TDL30725.1 hypothetical protein E2R51_17220 [Jeotgalibacillus sp. S-D1]